MPNNFSRRPPTWLETASESRADAPAVATGVAGAARSAFGAGLAEGEQRDDVVSRERRVGAVGQAELAGGSGEIQRDFVLLDRGGSFDVDHGVEAERVGEVDVAAGHFVGVAVKEEVARQHVDVAKDDRMFPGASDAEIGFGFEFGAGPLHAGVGCGDGFDVELKVAEEAWNSWMARSVLLSKKRGLPRIPDLASE